MRIANDLRKATVFLGFDIAGADGKPDIDARATGFYVTWTTAFGSQRPPRDETLQEQGGVYLVTARHCAEQLGSHFVIRFNKHDGTADVDRVDDPVWHFHDDPTVDVAIMHWGYPDWADVVPVLGRTLIRPTKNFDPDTVSTTADMGIGDIAYVVGLFNPLREKKINLPVVHSGHIALLPEDEKVPVYSPHTNVVTHVECYLMQTVGLDGLSGAPVFCRESHPVYGDYRPEIETQAGRRHLRIPGRIHGLTYLLGLWQSSWANAPDDTLGRFAPETIGRKVPLGFGVVVPAYKIAQVLNCEELVTARKTEYDRRMRESAAATDFLGGAPKQEGEKNPRHKEDFTRLLGAAAKSKRSSDQTSPGATPGSSGGKKIRSRTSKGV